MILKVTTPQDGDVMLDTAVDEIAELEKLFNVAKSRQMWGKATKNNTSKFLPTSTLFKDILEFDEVVMLPQQVGG